MPLELLESVKQASLTSFDTLSTISFHLSMNEKINYLTLLLNFKAKPFLFQYYCYFDYLPC